MRFFEKLVVAYFFWATLYEQSKMLPMQHMSALMDNCYTASPYNFYHSVNSCSHSVNGDIAIQWERSNFDPSQNPNPLTDYDKTLHNWLRPRDEHVTQNQ